ncbi:MAG: HAD-IIIC family phosphatase [Lachnospiraceae bacterium]|nr:HAD-IIIC family phosphatase [Lachnospiraceae bacterium]
MTYNELKKNIKRYKDAEYDKRVSIAILGDTATQFIATAAEGMSFTYGMRAEVYEAEYDVIESEILDPSSGLYEKERDHILIYMSVEKARETYEDTRAEKRTDFAADLLEKITGCWNVLKERTKAQIIQLNFARYDTGVFGSYALREESSFEFQLQKLNYLLSEAASHNKNIYIIDLDMIQARLGIENFCDRKFYYQARMAVGFEGVVETVKELYDIILASMGRIRKCLILDLDNTIWGGVIGDDGLSGIEIGELGTGRAYTDLQRWCLELKKRGILLAVCSKNDENTAKEPFEKHPDMVLHLSDFVMFAANWDDKATNIKRIQEALDIGLDSLVFVDDNPFERELVKSSLPGVTVPELPEDPAMFLPYLQSLHLFETVSFSADTANRTEMYRTEAKRRSEKEIFTDINDYLKSLDMKAKALPFDEFYYPRIAELSQRSNQFNLRTVRYSEEDIERIASSERYITRYFTLEDKFGDYGLISAVIVEKTGENEGFIDTWFMSCRVLKRGMEEFIINTVVAACREAGIERLTGQYIATAKNGMVSGIYERFGFVPEGEGRFTLMTGDYCPEKTHIREQ